MRRKNRKPDDLYLDFIRAQPCCVSTHDALNALHNCGGIVEAAHVGIRGLGQKCSDREAIPLCGWHHRTGPHAQHRIGKKFWAKWQLDKEALIKFYNDMFEETK